MTLFNPERLQLIKKRADTLIDSQQFAGISWNIEVEGRCIERGYSGLQCRDTQRPIQEDTLFRLYSMTKPVVAVKCLQLIEQGKLRLSDSINRWLPEFSHQKVLRPDGSIEHRQRSITVEDLLMHRSGLSYDFLPDCPVADLYRDARLAADGSRTLSELTSLLARFPLASNPGERWLYSYSTDVLACLLEIVSDDSLASLLQKGIFEPLGMKDTGFYVSQDSLPRLATMYGQRALGEVDQLDFIDNRLNPMDVTGSYPCDKEAGFSRGGLGLFSTLDDYSRFAQALITGQLLSGHTDNEPGVPLQQKQLSYSSNDSGSEEPRVNYPRLLSRPMVDFLWRNRLSPQQMPIAVGHHPLPGYGWGLVGRVMNQIEHAQWLTNAGEGGWAGAAATYFWVDRQYRLTGVVMTQYLGTAIPLGPDLQSLTYAAIE